MLALFLAVMAAAWLIEAADDRRSMHVHGSVVVARTGERTPVIAGDPVLSALGAQQMYTLGQNFRTRYVNEDGGPRGLGVQQMLGLSPNTLDNDQILIQTLDTPYLTNSAQSFMQGLYPPYAINVTRNGPTSDSTYLLANGTPIDFPMGGYQYAYINNVGPYDAQSAYLGGNQNCPVSQVDSVMYQTTDEYLQTKALHQDFYRGLNVDMFNGHFTKTELDYMNAYEIYDYLSYAYQHDETVYKNYNNDSINPDVIPQLQYLADEMAWYSYGNTSTSTDDYKDRAMGGKTLAALILGSFQKIVESRGNTSNSSAHALTLLFGEHEPLISLFSLMGVNHTHEGFQSIPPFGSALVFELYSIGDVVFPEDPTDLLVQFYFHNSSEYDGTLTPYPMFQHGPSVTELAWMDFQDSFSRIMVNTLEDWCTACNSPALFCWGVDDSSVNIVVNTSRKAYKITPAIAGVIGAIVTLAVAGLLFGLAMLLGGIRFHRVERKNNKSDLGGFKGSAKLASDADLSIAKNAAAPAGIVSFGNKDGAGRKNPHERVGSWELRQKEFGKETDMADDSRRGSFEAIEAALHAPAGGVQPHERV